MIDPLDFLAGLSLDLFEGVSEVAVPEFFLDEVGVQVGLLDVVYPPAAALRESRGSLLDSFLEVRAYCQSVVLFVDQLVLQLLCQVLLLGLAHFLALAEVIYNDIDHALDPAVKQLKIL